MKLKYFFIPLLFAAFTAKAQDPKLKAFSESYALEYAQNYTKAIQAIEKVYTANWYEANLRMGWLEYLQGDFAKSLTYYKKSIGLKPSSIEAKLGLVYPLAALGNWNEVEETYKEILQLDPKNSVVNYRMALINYNQKKSTQALEYVKKVINNYPFDYEANLLMGKIHLSLGNITEAKTALNKALLYDPTATEPAELLKGL